MGKKVSSDLGRSLRRKRDIVIKYPYRHSSDLPDGREFNCLNLRSITEVNSVDEFLSKTALAEMQFNTEFSSIELVQNDPCSLTHSEVQNEKALCIPRRPSWDVNESKSELDIKEKETFLCWRRGLAMIQEHDNVNITPFEKNLEVWRQLWRVIERSDIIIQVLDARNPLLFRCTDLEKYVKEVNQNKVNMLLLNKADFLTESQRQYWNNYFQSQGLRIIFFSALQQLERTENQDTFMVEDESHTSILNREELIGFLEETREQYFSEKEIFTAGFVGYPNVGKSSTINAILLNKKVSASSTPGKTKHFQTFMIKNKLCICDCPGLVFPNLLSCRAEMTINGILPIDHLKEWKEPISLIINYIPQNILESSYSLKLTSAKEEVTAEEFLNAYGRMRGFMTKHGLPDCARAARNILKDFCAGKLLCCVTPPDIDQSVFNECTMKFKKIVKVPAEQESSEQKDYLTVEDNKFFSEVHVKVNEKREIQDCDFKKKNWKKHNNKNKKEKLRRIYQSCN